MFLTLLSLAAIHCCAHLKNCTHYTDPHFEFWHCLMTIISTRNIWKTLGPFATASRFTLPFTRCRYCRTPPLSHAACASMSTTTTTMTTTTMPSPVDLVVAHCYLGHFKKLCIIMIKMCDRGDRYGPIEWAQQISHVGLANTKQVR